MTSRIPQTVFLVDDDVAVRDSLALFLGLKGYRSASFDSGEAFLAAHRKEWRGCLVLDIEMGGMTGFEMQSHLAAGGIDLPRVVISGHGDAASARAAFKLGAVDFLEKPLDENLFLTAVATALDCDAKRAEGAAGGGASRLVARLTPREREVLELVAVGRKIREIGEELGISPRTVEVYKARLMDKLEARNLAELIRIAVTLDHERRHEHIAA